MTRLVTDAEIIAHRLEMVRSTVARTMTDKQWLGVRDSSSVRSFGGVVHLRPLMLMKAALFDGGANLLTHWPIIERERRIPWGNHAGGMALSPWGAVGSEMHGQFYSTKTEDFTALELTMPGWHPVEETGIPGFATVSTEAALAAIGIIGGVHPDENDPVDDFGLQVDSFAVVAGTVTEFDLKADARADFPVRYELATMDLAWASLSEFGTLALAPSNVGGLFPLNINAIDGLGTRVSFTITVSVR